MNNIVKRLLNRYTAPNLDFRVRLFNVLALAGTLIGSLMAILGAVNNAGIFNVVLNIFGAMMARAYPRDFCPDYLGAAFRTAAQVSDSIFARP
jgi:hypothetical protein